MFMDKIGPGNADFIRNASQAGSQPSSVNQGKGKESEGVQEPLDQLNLDALRNKEKVELIIEADSPSQREALKKKLIEENPNNRITADLPLINGFAIELDRNSIGVLPELSKIAGNDVRVFLDGRISIPDPIIEKPGEVSALMDVAAKTMNVDKIHERGIKGQNVVACVIDTGIASSHKDLKGKVLHFEDMVNGKSQDGEGYDDQGHGSHCSSILGGTGDASDGKFKGVAPDVKLIGVKVLDKNGSGSFSDVVKGIQWAVENKDKYNIDVISMSLGGPTSSSAAKDPVAQAVAKAWDAGIVVCVAAGNSGPGKETISTPANEPKIITFGAMDDKGTLDRDDDTVAYFSSVGPTKVDKLVKPDLITPGVKITAADAFNPEGYTTMSGTSMATPFGAGEMVLAICADKMKNDGKKTLTPDDLKTLAMSTADKLKDPKIDENHQGKGALNIEKMVNTIFPPETPPA
jgi:serine protease AprX